jgi:hypothetical protein
MSLCKDVEWCDSSKSTTDGATFAVPQLSLVELLHPSKDAPCEALKLALESACGGDAG